MAQPAFPAQLAALLADPCCVKVLGTTDEAGAPCLSLCPTLTTWNGKTLVLGQALEKAPASKSLVGAIWRARPVSLLLSLGEETWHIQAQVYRCHIVGEVFSRMLEQVRAATGPQADLAAVWELLPTHCHREDLQPNPLYDLHLDNPLLHA